MCHNIKLSLYSMMVRFVLFILSIMRLHFARYPITNRYQKRDITHTLICPHTDTTSYHNVILFILDKKEGWKRKVKLLMLFIRSQTTSHSTLTCHHSSWHLDIQFRDVKQKFKHSCHNVPNEWVDFYQSYFMIYTRVTYFHERNYNFLINHSSFSR